MKAAIALVLVAACSVHGLAITRPAGSTQFLTTDGTPVILEGLDASSLGSGEIQLEIQEDQGTSGGSVFIPGSSIGAQERVVVRPATSTRPSGTVVLTPNNAPARRVVVLNQPAPAPRQVVVVAPPAPAPRPNLFIQRPAPQPQTLLLTRPAPRPTVTIQPEEPALPAKYDYAYSVNAPEYGDIKSAQESRDGEFVQGQYALIEPDGALRVVKYTADRNGFNAVVERTPGVGSPAPAPPAPIVPIQTVQRPSLLIQQAPVRANPIRLVVQQQAAQAPLRFITSNSISNGAVLGGAAASSNPLANLPVGSSFTFTSPTSDFSVDA